MKKNSKNPLVALSLGGLLVASCLSENKTPISPEPGTGSQFDPGGAPGTSGEGSKGGDSSAGQGGEAGYAAQNSEAGQVSGGTKGEAGQNSEAGQGGESGQSGQAGNQGLAGATPAKTCPEGLSGPPMTEVSSPEGKRYCVDQHEVTQGQYQAFVDAIQDDVSFLPPICAGVITYKILQQEPEMSYGCPEGVVDPKTKGDYPAECVTWCGAYAYCKWAGKRLCGKIGGGGMVMSEKDENYKDPSQSQWYNACSQGGKYAYSYGDTFLASCGMKVEKVGTEEMDDCKAKDKKISSIIKMNGSVSEWEDACQDGQEKVCRTRGGGYTDTFDTVNRLRCDNRGALFATGTYAGIGFRCCGDLD